MSNAVATVTTAQAPISIANGYTSITGDDIETRKSVFRAVSSATPLADVIGKPLSLANILVEPVQGENEITGEVEEYHRITLIDAKGAAFSAGSKGLYNSVQMVLNIFGAPGSNSAWPLDVVPVERKAAKGKFFALELV